ncbi:hypothetical protein IGK16_002375 [Enterococcus pernyi]
MNKQELKKIVRRRLKSQRPYTTKYSEGKVYAYKTVLGLLERLDEPQKPVVPKFVAEWFEDNKDVLDSAIFMAIRELDDEEWPHKTDFENWLDVVENKPIETLIRMKGGYEVKKEPMYYVYLPKIIVLPEMMIPDIEGAYLMKSGDEVELADNNDFEDMKFTESEIKAIDERYWAFAVPVEEVAEKHGI